MKVTLKRDSEAFKIYFDGILHIRFPVSNTITIQSWVERTNGFHVIEITSNTSKIKSEYESKATWVKVLNLLNKHL